MTRPVGRCRDCGREGVKGETRYDHGAKWLCDLCAAKPHHPPKAYASDFEEPAAAPHEAPAVPTDRVTGLAGRFRPVTALKAENPDPPEPVFGAYARRGDLVLWSGSPKGGKTTAVSALIEAVASGAGTFLGQPLATGAVVLVSEERTAALVAKLGHVENVHALTRDMAWPKPSWPDLVSAAVMKARQVGAVLLVIDTLRWWSDLAGKESNDDGAVMAAMRKLAPASAAGITTITVAHHRKGGGEGGEAVSGSGAFVGAVDVLLEWERVGGDAPRTVRQLVAVGRWPDMPPVLLVDFDTATRTYRVLGAVEDRGEARKLTWRERVLSAVPDEAPGATAEDLVLVVGAEKPKWFDALKELVADGQVDKAGKGVKGDPFRYSRIPSLDSVPAEDGKVGGGASPYSVLPSKEGRNQEAPSCRPVDSVPSAEDVMTDADVLRAVEIAERNADLLCGEVER